MAAHVVRGAPGWLLAGYAGDVDSAVSHRTSDLALLHLSSNPWRSHPDTPYSWRSPPVNPFPPRVGERVAAFGYRRGRARATKNSAGGRQINVDDEFMSSVGVVREIHQRARDRAMLPFPCYQVGARFDSGMSGGPVFDEYGSLCGLVCASIDGSDRVGEPISYVTTLWPLFTLMLPYDRGDDYPRGIRYPAIELARDGQIHVADRPASCRGSRPMSIRMSLRSALVERRHSSVGCCSHSGQSREAALSASFRPRVASDYRPLRWSIS